MNSADALTLDRLAATAWPAAERAPLGPWLLRATRGVTRRANSVLAVGAVDPHELESLVADAEAWYRERGLPPTFYLSDATPPAVDALLANRGYAISGASGVWVAETAAVAGAGGAAGDVRLAAAPDSGWFDRAFDEPADRRAVHEGIVERGPGPRAFASVVAGGATAGCGLAAADPGAGWAGVYCMATAPAHRRRGVARRVLGALAHWAAAAGAGRLYLQVMRENDAARALYAAVGFRHGYGYHYRVAD